MRVFVVFLCLALPVTAKADACRDEIVSLHDGGALDPFARPPHRIETRVLGPDDALKFEFDTVFDTPLKALSGMAGQMMSLSIGRRTWTGPGPDGPWTEAPNQLPEDLEGFHRATRDQLAVNLREVECLGLLDLDGTEAVSYRFTTQTDPNEAQGGTYFGATFQVWIEPERGLLLRQEQSGLFAHYQPEPGLDRHLATFFYDPGISLRPPD